MIKNINQIQNMYLKVLTTHSLLVTIQSFSDRNVCTSMFIMNNILLVNNYPWKIVTNHNYRIDFLSDCWKGDEMIYKRVEQLFKKLLEDL